MGGHWGGDGAAAGDDRPAGQLANYFYGGGALADE